MDLTIYHAEGRRSDRIVWLCEELNLPYTLEFKRGDTLGTLDKIRSVSPLMPLIPVIRYDGQVIVESGAIVELLLARHGEGRLAPAVDSTDYPYYLQWLHFAEGTAAARIVADYKTGMILGQKRPVQPEGWKLVDSQAVVRFADDFLVSHPYFGGREFSAADIMMHFVSRATQVLGVAETTSLNNFRAWVTNVEARPAFRRALAISLPDGLIDLPPALSA